MLRQAPFSGSSGFDRTGWQRGHAKPEFLQERDPVPAQRCALAGLPAALSRPSPLHLTASVLWTRLVGPGFQLAPRHPLQAAEGTPRAPTCSVFSVKGQAGNMGGFVGTPPLPCLSGKAAYVSEQGSIIVTFSNGWKKQGAVLFCAVKVTWTSVISVREGDPVGTHPFTHTSSAAAFPPQRGTGHVAANAHCLALCRNSSRPPGTQAVGWVLLEALLEVRFQPAGCGLEGLVRPPFSKDRCGSGTPMSFSRGASGAFPPSKPSVVFSPRSALGRRWRSHVQTAKKSRALVGGLWSHETYTSF